MATQGILAQSKPAAATDTVLYSAPIDSSASAVLTVANDGTASNYKVGLKNYDQKLTLDASTYLLHEGDVITGYRMTVNTAIASTNTNFAAGTKFTSDDKESTFNFESFYTPALTTIHIQEVGVRIFTIESPSGTFAVGETISKGTSPNDTTATVYGAPSEGGTTLYIGPSTINGTGTEFAASDSITASGGATATISTGGIGSEVNEFVFSTDGASGDYNIYITDTLTVFNDRTYKFDVSDSSMSGRTWRLSETANGVHASEPGTEYTTGKTSSGTPGSANAFVQYDFTQGTPPETIYFYDNTVSTYGGTDRGISISGAPTYEEFYVYDVDGTWTNSTDTFTTGGTTYTVTAQTVEPYGYVRSYSGTTLYVIKGTGSGDFAGTDTFKDNPKLSTADRSTCTVSSVGVASAALEAENYIINDVANSANNVDRTTSLVIGPGERVVVHSTTQNNSFSLVGFEDSTTGFTTRVFAATANGGGGE